MSSIVKQFSSSSVNEFVCQDLSAAPLSSTGISIMYQLSKNDGEKNAKEAF